MDKIESNPDKKLATSVNPRLFISYSWSSPQHEQWVLQLSTELRESSVDVILDKWDLKEGNDANAFMEKMVSDPGIKKVVLICNKKYAEKADERSGGVGTEAQIISPEIYSKQDQTKFVAVVAEKDDNGKPYLPVYYKSRIYIDLSDNEQYAKNFEQLLRWVFDEPLYIKPELGIKPAFLDESAAIALGTNSRAIEAIRNSRPHTKGAVQEYLDVLAQNLEKFRIAGGDGEFDEKVMENIGLFVPYRSEAIELFSALAQYKNTNETHNQLHRFFERLIPYLQRPEGLQSYRTWDFDNFKFIIHELFLCCLATFIRHEAFSGVAYLLENRYFVENNPDYGRDSMQSYKVFRVHLESLEHRNKRLELRKLSLHADILKDRSVASALTFEHEMQADFVVFLRDCVEAVTGGNGQSWWPVTLLYKSFRERMFEIFARAESSRYFDLISPMLGIKKKDDLRLVFDGFQSGKLHIPTWQFDRINPASLMNYDKLATRP
jgi:hypothetical protein